MLFQKFPAALPPLDSDMANQIFKDPYLFDFLGTDMPRREVEIEQKLTEHIQSFLLELGQGFAFVGRQVHLEVGGQDFYLDHREKMITILVLWKKRCYASFWELQLKVKKVPIGGQIKYQPIALN